MTSPIDRNRRALTDWRHSAFGWFDYLLVAAPALTTPLIVWANNLGGVGYPGRLVLIGLFGWLFACLSLGLLRRLGVSRALSLFATWGVSYVLVRGRVLPDSFGFLVASLILLAVVSIVVYLLSTVDSGRLRLIVVIASALLVGELLITAYTGATSVGVDNSEPSPAPLSVSLQSAPDIVLVVADAYIGVDGLRRVFGAEPTIRTDLENLGFWLPDIAYSNYASTSASLSALLDMSYPLEGGTRVNDETKLSLYGRIGGDNRLVEALKANEYEVTMIESGWSGSVCGADVDHCVSSAFLDEAVFAALARSWLGAWTLRRSGYAFTAGALRSMSWLLDNVEEITHDATPDLVVAHLEIPHPPFFLDEDCELAVSDDRSGVTLRRSGVETDLRSTMYLDQAACVDAFITRLSSEVHPESLLFLIGDHGSDRHDQMVTDQREWSVKATYERFNVMFAMRGREQCRPSEPVVLVNVFRAVLECLGGQAVPEVPPRMFKYSALADKDGPLPVVEVEPNLVRGLLNGSLPHP